jgi:hypothetical protein
MSEVTENIVVERSVFRIAPPEVTATWARVVGFFSPVFAQCKTHDPDDVRQAILLQKAQLWVQWNSTDAVIECAFVTEFIGYPKGVWVRLWLGGAAPDAKVDYHAVQGALTLWARQNSARGFEIVGRHGWLRKFPEAVLEGLCMRSTFDG